MESLHDKRFTLLQASDDPEDDDSPDTDPQFDEGGSKESETSKARREERAATAKAGDKAAEASSVWGLDSKAWWAAKMDTFTRAAVSTAGAVAESAWRMKGTIDVLFAVMLHLKTGKVVTATVQALLIPMFLPPAVHRVVEYVVSRFYIM